MQQRFSRRNRAFTLVEILIVVIIIGILAAIVIPQFTNASTQARDEAFKTNLRDLVGVAMLYHQKYGALPAQAAGATVPAELLAASGRTEFPLATPIGGCWHVGNIAGHGWGVGVWWPGDEDAEVKPRAEEMDQHIDDGDGAAGRFIFDASARRYYWMID